MKIRVGAKESDVSVALANGLAEELREQGHDVDLVLLPDTGDRESIGQLRLGLLRDDFDVAIHRMNRVPTAVVPGLRIAAIPARGDARDAVCARNNLPLSGLPDDSVLATQGPLRRANVRRARPQMRFEDIEPSLSACLDRVAQGTLDGVVASAADIAALDRGGRQHRHLGRHRRTTADPVDIMGMTGADHADQNLGQCILIRRQILAPEIGPARGTAAHEQKGYGLLFHFNGHGKWV